MGSSWLAQNFVEAVGEVGSVAGAQRRDDRGQLVETEHQVELVGLDVQRFRSHGSVCTYAGQTLGVVTPNEENCGFGIVESLPCERLDMAAAVICQIPVRIVVGEFADVCHPHG